MQVKSRAERERHQEVKRPFDPNIMTWYRRDGSHDME